MRRIVFLILYLIIVTPCIAKEVSIDDVYQQAYRINEEIEILKNHFGIKEMIQVAPIYANFTSSHTWQKTYEILFKLNVLRKEYDLPVIAVPAREPKLRPKPQIVFEQALRILTEIEIIKYQLDITKKSSSPPEFSGKTLADNFNLMNHISYQIDLLTGSSFTPSYVFAQAMRISEDVNSILDSLNIQDDTIPPPKQNDAILNDAFKTALQLLQEIKRIEQLGDVQGIETYPFEKMTTITPAEVFNITGIILAELQGIKARLNLSHELTPVAEFYENKTPDNVKQIFDWCLRKLRLVTTLIINKN